YQGLKNEVDYYISTINKELSTDNGYKRKNCLAKSGKDSSSKIIETSSELFQTGSELISTSSELISTGSELIRTITEQILTIVHRVVQTTAGRWKNRLKIFV
ncbi:MAG: hypothetical protein UDG28_00610, partial [Prevotellamassilia sp.]|nr:hypothetical protein [Prevotellamassilia sp.]